MWILCFHNRIKIIIIIIMLIYNSLAVGGC